MNTLRNTDRTTRKNLRINHDVQAQVNKEREDDGKCNYKWQDRS